MYELGLSKNQPGNTKILNHQIKRIIKELKNIWIQEQCDEERFYQLHNLYITGAKRKTATSSIQERPILYGKT